MKTTIRTTFVVAMYLGLASMSRAQNEKPTLEKRAFTDAKGKSLPYRLLKPENYDPKKMYPLVLFLHGAGERGDDNEKQLVHGIAEFVKNRDKYPCFLAAPQCPKDEKWADWRPGALITKEPTEPTRLALELVAALEKEFAVDSNRIYVTGLSMGGFGTWDLISRNPDRFAAAVPICGGGDVKQAANLTKVPIWAFHGGKDQAVKPELSRTMIEAVKKAGGNPLYTEYPDVGHDSWVKAYQDAEMFKWLFERKKGGS